LIKAYQLKRKIADRHHFKRKVKDTSVLLSYFHGFGGTISAREQAIKGKKGHR